MNSDLWDWALRAYAGEGVAEACLALQDDHGQCVPLLLWAAWRGDASQAEAAAQIARDWQAVIVPLRDARRRLKTEVSAGDEADRLALRTQVKAAELQAEKVLLARLATLSDGKSMLNQDVAISLRATAAAWGGPIPEDALARLAQALTKGDFLRYT
ncbi:MAG TPA: TIGR02444 family protein [Asticcacaulis sp.]|nr:TIGR02444 family protein [Asticcacaulis sp.]